MNRLGLITVAALPLASAFAPVAPSRILTASSNAVFIKPSPLFAEPDDAASEAVFVAPEEGKVDEDISFAKAESLGRGAAKVRHFEILGEFNSLNLNSTI